jgi:hypothetical protein
MPAVSVNVKTVKDRGTIALHLEDTTRYFGRAAHKYRSSNKRKQTGDSNEAADYYEGRADQSYEGFVGGRLGSTLEAATLLSG